MDIDALKEHLDTRLDKGFGEVHKRLDQQTAEIGEIRIQAARADERSAAQAGRILAVEENHKGLSARLWAVILAVIVAVVGGIAKALGGGSS